MSLLPRRNFLSVVFGIPRLGTLLLLVLAAFVLLYCQIGPPVFKRTRDSYDDFPYEALEKRSGTNPPSTSNSDQINVNKNGYKFIIMTKSAPKMFDTRKFLREESWLSHDWRDSKNRSISWKHYFLVGLSVDVRSVRPKLRVENSTYSDIILTDTIDMYELLTYKVLWGFQYAVRNINFKFLAILSEDTVVNVAGLDEFVSGLMDRKYFYGGPNCANRKVPRAGKWGTPKEEYLPDRYPKYCIGSGLVFSFETVKELVRAWNEDRQPVSKIDDVHIGLLLHYSGKTPVTQINQITRGCHAKRNDTFIVSQIKPLTVGAQLIRNFREKGYYCEETVKPHSRWE